MKSVKIILVISLGIVMKTSISSAAQLEEVPTDAKVEFLNDAPKGPPIPPMNLPQGNIGESHLLQEGTNEIRYSKDNLLPQTSERKSRVEYLVGLALVGLTNYLYIKRK